MTVKLLLPSNLSAHCQGKRVLAIDATDVDQVLHQASATFPNLESHLWTSDGTLHRYVNIFVNDKNIRDLDLLKTLVVDGDEVLIVPALAGG